MWTVEVAPPEWMGDLMAVSSRFLVDRRILIRGREIVGEEAVVPAYEKDYDAFPGDHLSDWPKTFGVATWGLMFLRDSDGQLAGGTVVAARDHAVGLLEGRDDLAHVFDIRVTESLRGQGLGRKLWEATLAWCINQGISELRVETQDVNAAACFFYNSMGCRVHKVDSSAYPHEMREAQIIWALPLQQSV